MSLPSFMLTPLKARQELKPYVESHPYSDFISLFQPCVFKPNLYLTEDLPLDVKQNVTDLYIVELMNKNSWTYEKTIYELFKTIIYRQVDYKAKLILGEDTGNLSEETCKCINNDITEGEGATDVTVHKDSEVYLEATTETTNEETGDRRNINIHHYCILNKF